MIETLKTKINRKGEFNTDRFGQLADALEKCDPASEADQELIASANDFVAGKIRERMFVAFLKDTLATGTEMKLKGLTPVADRRDAKPTLQTEDRRPIPQGAINIKIEDIQINTGGVARLSRVIGPIEARVSQASVFGKHPKYEDVNLKLRQEAMKKGANAVINVKYHRSDSFASLIVLTATGTAVYVEPDK